jgi:hypothetical protein
MEKLELIAVKNGKVKGNIANITITPKLDRVSFSRAAIDLMIKEYGQQFTCTQLLKSKNNKTLWVKPCNEEDAESRSLGKGKSKSLHCQSLFQALGWEETEPKKFLVVWDTQNQAVRIDLSKSL